MRSLTPSNSDVRALVDGGENIRELTGLEGSILLLEEGGGGGESRFADGGEVTSDVCRACDAVMKLTLIFIHKHFVEQLT